MKSIRYKSTIIFAFIILSFFIDSYAQSFSKIYVKVNNQSVELNAFKRNDIVFISAKEFASKLRLQYAYSEEHQKAEIIFPKFNLKITARNPFVALFNKEEQKKEIVQLPISTIVIQNDILFPLDFMRSTLSRCFNSVVTYSETRPDIVDLPNQTEQSDTTEKEEEINFADIKFDVDEKVNGTLLEINFNKKIRNVKNSLRNNILTLDVTELRIDEKKFPINFTEGLVREVRATNTNNGARLQFTLHKDFGDYEVLHNRNEQKIFVTIHNKSFQAKKNRIRSNRDRWNFDVIVLDAGHGGKDPGAIGRNKSVEKNITLAITLKLGKMLEENMKDVKVVYTRKDDRFVELYRRGKIANDNDGKLFISIHCNSTPNKKSNASGSEVYLLRPGRTDDAIAIAARENSVIEFEADPKRYQKLTDENFILVSMAQAAHMQYSEKFAEMLDKQFRQNLDIPSRGVKQAGFFVLVGASMPSVLVEAGYLSNPTDEKYLMSKKGQEEVAQSIFNAIKSFKNYYDLIIREE